MNSEATTRASRPGLSVSKYPNPLYGVHNSSSSQQALEVKVKCKNCNREFLVPTCTNNFSCPQCRTNNAPNQGQGQSSGSKMRRGNKCIIFNGRVDSGNRNGYVREPKPSLSAESSLSFSRRYNKRAVLCGVTYMKSKFRLKGTVNDVRNIKTMLTDIFGFQNESIRVLTEQPLDIAPTKKNILDSLNWLVKDCQPGDSLVFYFSGHGLQQPDLIEDEIDGFDETICPVDFLREGMIVDNEINSLIVRPLEKYVTLHAIVDACHSGTILDLEYVYNREKDSWDDNKPPAEEPIPKKTKGGLAICIGACNDDELASDTNAFGGKGMNGLVTYLLTKIVKENREISYGNLLDKLHDEIEKVIQRRCKPSFLRHIIPKKIAEDPILSSSKEFDIYQRKFIL